MMIISMVMMVSMFAFVNKPEPMDENRKNLVVATFAGGCFWCVEANFESVNGVGKVISGYTGGHDPAPNYTSVSSGTTGHTEVVQIHLNLDVVSYDTLLNIFWHHIDPTDACGQFVDRGFPVPAGNLLPLRHPEVKSPGIKAGPSRYRCV